jgi:uncharacterized protein YutE (UPF0331/DUF86 family)
MDKERISAIIASIEKNMNDICERFKGDNFNDRLKFDAGCMSLFQAINRSIDLAEEMIAIKRLVVPGSYSDSFDILWQAKYIREDVCCEMKKLVQYRNVISHEYYNVNAEDVKKILKKIHVIDDFLEDIKKCVK